jgi:F0F1-type ATP synthase epsilon subunit
MKKTILVIVRDSENIVFDGEVDRISSFNEVGRFDIYPTHANFISIIKQELSLYKDHKLIKELKIEQAILKAKKDQVGIFLGIDTLIVDEEQSIKNAEKSNPKDVPK